VSGAKADLSRLGTAVLGISPDAPAALKKFDEKQNLDFPLLSDADHAAAQAYGVWAEKTMYGKKVMGIVRSSFLIDEQGKIIKASYKIKPENTVPEAMGELQKT
jgi:thioredoxin-dependent peroxiredoxin